MCFIRITLWWLVAMRKEVKVSEREREREREGSRIRCERALFL